MGDDNELETTSDADQERQDEEESVRDEGRDEAAVTISAIDAKLDQVLSAIGRLQASVDGLPTFERAVDDGAVLTDEAPAGAPDVETALPTSDLSDLDFNL